jgi:hypothetical protein
VNHWTDYRPRAVWQEGRGWVLKAENTKERIEMTQYDGMEIDIRKHPQVRADVCAGLLALKIQARQIWGTDTLTLPQIVLRLMVGVGDLARIARNGVPPLSDGAIALGVRAEIKKELGNVVFSTIRWIDDLGLDVLECLDLAIEAQEKFVNSGQPR